jgi:hypothetical protein
MKAKGPKHERETIIRFDEESATATVWTASNAIYKWLRQAGYVPTEDNGRSASFDVPKTDIKLPRPRRKRTLTDEQRRQAAARMVSARNAVFCSPGQLN